MAKKKKETGPGVFLILTLVFFVLTSVVLGVTTYLGFEDAAQQAGAAKTATDDKNVAVKNAAEQTIRRNMNRIAMGTQDPEDQTDISGAAKEHSLAILEEYDRITKRLGANAFPMPGQCLLQLSDRGYARQDVGLQRLPFALAHGDGLRKGVACHGRKRSPLFLGDLTVDRFHLQ